MYPFYHSLTPKETGRLCFTGKKGPPAAVLHIIRLA